MTMPETTAPPQATCTAPVNIAVVKYWGKRDTKRNLPTNASLSVTLAQDDLCTKTSASLVPRSVAGASDRLWLNGCESDVAGNSRLRTVFEELRKLARERLPTNHPVLGLLDNGALVVNSKNSFPTAAGLASSASGYACLVAAVSRVLGLDAVLSPDELSRVARLGSGSACRSMFGGFVEWAPGTRADGLDSVAVQVAPESHWPEMSAVVLVVHSGRKGVSSTSGMQATVETSALLQHRISSVVPARMDAMRRAIRERDFDVFARHTMADSNQFHACCLDTFPPIFYMNDVSRWLVALVEAFNGVVATPERAFHAAYTYDAGPNAVVYLLRDDVPAFAAFVRELIPLVEFPGVSAVPAPGSPELFAALGAARPFTEGSVVERVIVTRVGPGPIALDATESLLGSDGLPSM